MRGAIGNCVKFRTEEVCREIIGVVSSIRKEVVRPAGVDDGTYDPAFMCHPVLVGLQEYCWYVRVATRR